MDIPALDSLKEGRKYDLVTLVEHFEITDEFWNWWWDERATFESISRPEIIADEDPVLIETIENSLVNLRSNSALFTEHLNVALQRKILPPLDSFQRTNFQEIVCRYMSGCSTLLKGQPELIFTAGGYGSGKTVTIQMLAQSGKLPVEMRHSLGVDNVKPFIPEYNLIQGVRDGRASLTVQKECQMMADRIFDSTVHEKRSFIWDSSLSDLTASIAKIKKARDAGYRLTMVAVLTPMKVAIRQAMRRAKNTCRFPNPVALPHSHVKFRENFSQYPDMFDCVHVFAKDTVEHAGCYVAKKINRENILEVMDDTVFSAALLN